MVTGARGVLLFSAIGLAIASSVARAGPLVVPRPTTTPGVTSINDKQNITTTMGLQLTETNDAGDSLRWWDRRDSGWRRWTAALAAFPRVRSKPIETYLAALAEGFTRHLPEPKTRFHFYVADTLNPSLWPAGGGFFVIHAGLINRIRDERHFAFLIALEMAHEALGHNFMPVRAGDIKWEPGSWRKGDFDGWSVEFWAYIVGRDPIERGGFAYTLQQESDALELVYKFFAANVWEYEGVNRLVADLLPAFDEIPGSSSLSRLHANLKTAVLLPHARPASKVMLVDPIVNRETYTQVMADLAKSTLQRYPWMLELVPYRDFVLAQGIDFQRLREEYDEHAHASTSRFDSAGKRPRGTSLEADLAAFEDRNEDLYDRGKIPSARLARAYLKGLILLGNKRWLEVVANAELGLKIDPKAEPFLWQRALARQQLAQFGKCIAEMGDAWANFDHRRALVAIECSFLEGRYSDTAVLVDEYRRKYPFDVDGAFWQGLTNVRLHRMLDSSISEIVSFWGDRPMMRALQIFYYGYLGKLSKARAAVDFKSDLRYRPAEWGVLEFAQAWLRVTFSPIHDDDRADQLRKLSEAQWPLARLVKFNLPRDPVEER